MQWGSRMESADILYSLYSVGNYWKPLGNWGLCQGSIWLQTFNMGPYYSRKKGREKTQNLTTANIIWIHLFQDIKQISL